MRRLMTDVCGVLCILGILVLLFWHEAKADTTYNVDTFSFTLAYSGQDTSGISTPTVALSCARVFKFQLSDKTKVSQAQFVLLLPGQVALICAAPAGFVIPTMMMPTSGVVSVYVPRPPPTP